MDDNIYHLNLDYLILAHELIQSGRQQQAMMSLGLTPEAVSILAQMPVDQLKALARSDVLSFAPRFPASSWRTFLRNEAVGSESMEQRARRLRLVWANQGSSMIAEGVSYEERLRNYQLATELLKRKLRTSYVSQLIKSISLTEIRDMHRAIHQGERPSSGLLPAIEAIPKVRESMLYLSLFASLYRHASQADIKTEMDVPAIIVA